MKSRKVEGSKVERKICWYENNLKHRDDGPAVEWDNGTMEWWINNMRHREDGPALVIPGIHQSWWINNKRFTEEEFSEWRLKKELNEKLQSSLPPKPITKRGKI